jgi:hypothetical protein
MKFQKGFVLLTVIATVLFAGRGESGTNNRSAG